jgi:chromosome segregation ATPase
MNDVSPDGGLMTDSPALTIDACEVVDAGMGDALLRLHGSSTETDALDFQLYVPRGDAGHLIAPLPPGPTLAGDGSWSVAFAIDPAAASERLALVPTEGGVIAFTPHGRHPAPAPSADDRLERALDDLADAEATVDQLRHRCELNERGLSELREKLVQAWAEAGKTRDLLESRESAYDVAKKREQAALSVVTQLEARGTHFQEELAAHRREMEVQCARLAAEIERRTAAEVSARDELAAAAGEVDGLRERATEALARFEEARAEAQGLQAQLADAKAVAGEARAAAEGAGQELAEERARTEQASQLADLYSERLAKAERELREAHEQLDEATTSHETASEASEELADARERIAAADERIEELETKVSGALAAAEEVESERARAADAGKRAEAESIRAGEAELQLAEARDRLSSVEETTKALATTEHALRQELESLTRTDLGQESRGRALRSKVSVRAYREALAKLEHEQAERARLEQESARLAEQVSALENVAEQSARVAEEVDTAAQEAVEADLRHLLAVAQRDLDEARAALNEQQARYAAVASEAVADDVVPGAGAATPAGEKPWTAVDDDLLSRLQRAKEFAGSD